MQNFINAIAVALLVLWAGPAPGQSQAEDAEELKIAAVEALISAPADRALPLVQKVMAGDHSDEVKERALFVLSQIERPEAHALLLETARTGSGDLQEEAIRMIGIGGDDAALAGLEDLYNAGDRDVRDAVLEAYLIADDADAVYRIAAAETDEDAYEEAVEMLAAMGASAELRELRNARGMSESLIEAYAISGDSETLLELARDDSDAELQTQAIEALGIVGGPDVNATLVEIYRSSPSEDVREAVLHGMMISGHDEGVLELYRASDDAGEKRELLEYLVMMDSDAVWDIIDSELQR